MKLPLSLVIITLNEAHNLRRCIESVPMASEIIVVDSESQDDTIAIAQSLGARVTIQKFLGYRKQKQMAHDLATQPWVLSLDADEALSPEAQKEISQWVSAHAEVDGVEFPRVSFHLGRWIRHGGWYPDRQLRLYRKNKARWLGGEVHERVEVDGHVVRSKSEIQHFVFRDLSDQIDTNNEFSSLGARDLFSRNRPFRLWRLILKPVGKFFECYIWKAGFLDGAPGFIIALGAAQSLFLKYAKLWELEKFNSTSAR
ncbi:MAG: glycosyltransferase family 2 protein [Oligoflexia bacterium]|nr:glycosyltransferase family 2 protein [Oligoflexia bacterium]